MFIAKVNNNGTDYLRLVENEWIPGSPRPRKKVVLNIGPLKRFDDGKPDFIGRLRESFKEGRPIIPGLQEYANANAVQENEGGDHVLVKVPLNEETPLAAFHSRCLADLILNAYMSGLGLSQLFRQIKSERRLQYDLLGFVKLVAYGRILSPCSKRATVRGNEGCHDPILCPGFNPYNVYDMLGVVHESRMRIFRAMDRALRLRPAGRDSSIIFYDVTNFFFETEENDPDTVEDGVVVEEGLRKRGHSKEGRPQPIVQMGLFMDRDGVPVGMKTFPGNTVDKSTLVDATAEVIGPMGYGRFVYCADRGLCTMANIAHIVGQGMGYLLGKSIKKTKKEEREWIIEPDGYAAQSDAKGETVFKHKSRIVERKAEDAEGNEQCFKEKVVVFWSREYCERERHMNESFSNFLKGLEDGGKAFTLSAGQVKGIQRFLKDEVLDGLDPDNDAEKPESDKGPAKEPASGGAGSPSGAECAGPGKEKDGQGKSQPGTAGRREENTAGQTEKKPSADGGGTAAEPGKKKGRKRLAQEEKDLRAAEKKAEAARKKSIKESRKKRLAEDLRDSGTARKMIDWDKVNQWREYAGYYQIVTSETKMDDMDVIGKYRLLTQIENRFRTMKGTLDARPVYVRDPAHIDAHLVLCTVALAIMCLIQGKAKEPSQGAGDKMKWEAGMSPDRVQAALNRLEAEEYAPGIYRFADREQDETGRDLQRILDAHGIEIPRRFYTAGDIKRLRGSVKAF